MQTTIQIIFMMVFSLAQYSGNAQDKSLSISSRFVNEKIDIDGKLNEKIYSETESVFLVNSINSKVVLDQKYQTKVWIYHDMDNLYVAFECMDKHIWTKFTQRDEHLWEEEAVEVFIDTDENPNDYVEIEVSPSNILYDSYIVDPKNIDVKATSAFDLSEIKTAVSIIGTLNDDSDIDEKWQVEISIPFNELKKNFDSEEINNNKWKINFYRINHDDSEYQYMAWSPTEGSFHTPEVFGTLTFTGPEKKH